MRFTFLTLFGAAVLAGCGAAATPSSSPSNGSVGSTAPTVSTGKTSLGTVLTDSQGMTLYYFLPEKGGKIGACDASCLKTWPPVTVTGSPTSSSGVTGTLGVVPITLSGVAESEVTYNSWPLHRYAGDSAAGQTNGQNIANVWFATEPATTSTETGATTGSSGTPAASTPTPSSTSTGGYGY
jgi:predicted lipoprotein with Yx(FWY)xxD motif